MQTARTVRYQGFIVREVDVVNYLVLGQMPRDAAERHVAKAPTWEGKPLDFNEFKAAIEKSNRNDELWSMARS